MAGMFDLDKELKVAEEFWDFLGGDGRMRIYQGVLNVLALNCERK